MTVELICVGTELLLGNIVNTNAAYLAEKCAGLGLSCYYQTVVGDNAQRLAETLQAAVKRADIVILSGGLGPTEDDLTKEAAAKVMNRELVEDAASREHIEKYFASRNAVPTENNWKQAMMPQGGIILPNPNGTAPGVIIADDATHVVLLPGPPHELKPMFENYVIPYINKLEPGVIASQTVKVCGIGESRVEILLQDLIDGQENPTLATYAKPGEVHIRVTAKAEGEKEARKLIKPVVKEIKSRMGNNIYTTDEEVTLEKAVVDLLVANELTVTCAESCTGGLLSGRLINVAGVSQVYKSGYVTYSNKAKRKLLGVKKSTLEKHGAVSRQTAEEMARGLSSVAKSDVAVAVTGIAGPDGGTEEKPIGLVYISCYCRGRCHTQRNQYTGSRGKIRAYSVATALTLLRQTIIDMK